MDPGQGGGAFLKRHGIYGSHKRISFFIKQPPGSSSGGFALFDLNIADSAGKDQTDRSDRSFVLRLKHRYRALFLVISTEEINAVSGIASIIPILAEIPLIVSNATKAVENR